MTDITGMRAERTTSVSDHHLTEVNPYLLKPSRTGNVAQIVTRYIDSMYTYHLYQLQAYLPEYEN